MVIESIGHWSLLPQSDGLSLTKKGVKKQMMILLIIKYDKPQSGDMLVERKKVSAPWVFKPRRGGMKTNWALLKI